MIRWFAVDWGAAGGDRTTPRVYGTGLPCCEPFHMPIARLKVETTCLLLIDVQERLISEMHEAQRLVARCRYLAQIAGVLGLPVAVTEQYVRGLGHTVGSLREVIPQDAPVFEKTRFSGCIDPIKDWLEGHGRPNILLAGMEAHVCILQTGLDLLASGKIVFAVLDAISGGEPDQIAPAIDRLQRAGAIITGCVSATYELLRDAGHPAFRDCLPHVKTIRSSK